jgi:hypothetical protein
MTPGASRLQRVVTGETRGGPIRGPHPESRKEARRKRLGIGPKRPIYIERAIVPFSLPDLSRRGRRI